MFVSSTATLASTEFRSSIANNWQNRVNEMAMNAVIQKHSSLPGTPVTLTNNHNAQSFFIPRPSEGIQVAPVSRGGTTNYIAVNQVTSDPHSGGALQTILAPGGQVIQGTPIALSQIQTTDLSHSGQYYLMWSTCNTTSIPY